MFCGGVAPPSQRAGRFLTLVILSAAVRWLSAAPVAAADPAPVLENSYVGIYKALAALTYDDFKKGDNFAAASHARDLETFWDRETQMKSKNHPFWHEVDDSMDAFIGPIIDWSFLYPPDPAAVAAAYKDFLATVSKSK